MDFYIVLTRSGKRVKYRKRRRSKMGTYFPPHLPFLTAP